MQMKFAQVPSGMGIKWFWAAKKERKDRGRVEASTA